MDEDVAEMLRQLKIDLSGLQLHVHAKAGLLLDTLILLKKEHGPAGVGVLRIAVRSNICR